MEKKNGKGELQIQRLPPGPLIRVKDCLLVHNRPTFTSPSDRLTLDLTLTCTIDRKGLIRHELVVVQFSVSEEKHNAYDEETDSWRGPNPNQLRILDSGYDDLCDGATEGVLEEKYRHNHGFHVFR